MSRLNKKSNIPIIEEETFFTEPNKEVEEYKPQHPTIAFIEQVVSENKKADHLEDYVEVKPFE